jgi:tetratricopeptide (TPR) repeat protein
VLALIVGISCASADIARAGPPELDAETDADDTKQPKPEPEPQTAGEWYARGYELGNAGDYAAAAEAFLRSYALKPTSEALFNAALALENAESTLTAIATYERFLAEPARKEELVDAAQRSIDAMLREVAVLKGVRFSATRPPTQLLVQGQPVELDAFPVLVMPGEIEIEVVDAHGVRARETYELGAGEALVVDLRSLLPPPPREPGPKPITDPGPSAGELEAARARGRLALTLRKTAWAGVGVSGAAAISVVTLGLLARRERRLFDAGSCYSFVDSACPDDFELGDPEAHERAYRQYALGATVMGSVTAGLGLATLVVGLVSIRRADQARQAQGGSSRHDRASVRVTPALGGLTLQF